MLTCLRVVPLRESKIKIWAKELILIGLYSLMSLWEPAIYIQRRPQHEVLGSVHSAHRIYRPTLETHKDELLLFLLAADT